MLKMGRKRQNKEVFDTKQERWNRRKKRKIKIRKKKKIIKFARGKSTF